jgi:HPt (histidine-containing phosphotransfer) domain-containing protein
MAVGSDITNDSDVDPFAKAYLALQQQFVAGLNKRQTEISQAKNHTALISALHRLAGAAGSYGFTDLSTLARQAIELGYDDKTSKHKLNNSKDVAKSLTILRKKIDLEINRISQLALYSSIKNNG